MDVSARRLRKSMMRQSPCLTIQLYAREYSCSYVHALLSTSPHLVVTMRLLLNNNPRMQNFMQKLGLPASKLLAVGACLPH